MSDHQKAIQAAARAIFEQARNGTPLEQAKAAVTTYLDYIGVKVDEGTIQ